MRLRPLLSAAVALSVGAAACGGSGSNAGADRPSIVVTTSILGNVVEAIVGDEADVKTIMPAGANPHDFQASAQEAAAIRSADLLVVNGGGFEEGLTDVIEGAEQDGIPVVKAIEFVEPLEGSDDDGHGHGEGSVEPHFFTDPTRMATAVTGITDAILHEVLGVDSGAIEAAAEAYRTELGRLDVDIEARLEAVASDNRVLVTNHEVFGYFADRYDFEVVGVVVPGGGTGGGGSSRELADLVKAVRDRGVPAIFTDASGSAGLARTLAAEVGNVEVVELFTESLGKPGSGGATYIEMMRTNAERIAEALT